MNNEKDIKKIERTARSMLMSKEIPPAKMEVVRSLLNNEKLLPEERYATIISLIKNCQDKKVIIYEDEKESSTLKDLKSKSTIKKDIKKDDKTISINDKAPTESSLYIDDIYNKYKNYNIFKKRFLVHRNNRLGIGIRKRLIPTKQFQTILHYLAYFQEQVVLRLSLIMTSMLNDETIEDPTVFNYLRMIKKWMNYVPLVKYKSDTIKWMERQNFEREFGGYIRNYFSFLTISSEIKQNINIEVEKKLRLLDDLRKDVINPDDSDKVRLRKEKNNVAREKEIYDFMKLFRSFFEPDIQDDTGLLMRLKLEFNINNVFEFLMITAEALLFQKPLTYEYMSIYLNIKEPIVSSTEWDYSEDFLKKIGKDLESRKKKKLNILRDKIAPYEILYIMLKKTWNDQNILIKALEDEWKYVDKKMHDATQVYNDNYFIFLDNVLQYFNYMFIPLLDGSIIHFKDLTRTEYKSSIFTASCFKNELSQLNSILDDIFFIKSNNPTLAVTRDEAKKIMSGKLNSMTRLEKLFNSVGNCFYAIGRELQKVYELHRLWIFNGRVTSVQSIIRIPIDNMDSLTNTYDMGRPIPFHDSSIIGMENNSPLLKEILDKKIIDDSLKWGIFVHMLSFSYQIAFDCMNEKIYQDLHERKMLLKEIEEIS